MSLWRVDFCSRVTMLVFDEGKAKTLQVQLTQGRQASTLVFCHSQPLLCVLSVPVQGDTSGDYRKTLLVLCGGED